MSSSCVAKHRSRTETPFNPIDGPIDGHRNFFRWASMDHRWPSMGFELSPSAWGQLWSIFGLNISNFNLLSFPFEPEQANVRKTSSMPIDGPLMAIDGPHGTAMAIDELRWDLSTGFASVSNYWSTFCGACRDLKELRINNSSLCISIIRILRGSDVKQCRWKVFRSENATNASPLAVI